jgi:hypothetical protein
MSEDKEVEAFRAHYCSHGAELVFPKKKSYRNLLYRAICKCGFTCEAYGKETTNNQMMGHIKTMMTLASLGYMKSTPSEDELLTEEEIKVACKNNKHISGLVSMADIYSSLKAQIAKLKDKGYVQLAKDQTPPELNNELFSISFNSGYKAGQQDMLSVDSEGCAYKRVKVK